MMGKICGFISGLMMMVAGVALLLFGLGTLNAMLANVVAGALLALFGLSFLVHKLGACPVCKVPETKGKGR